jgi:hypothetical protein
MAVAQLDITTGSNVPALGSPGRRQDTLLFMLWGVFWVLMLGVALRDYLQGGGRDWWKPVLWEGSAMVFATLLLLVQRGASVRLEPLIAHPWRWFGAQLKWLPLAGILMISLFYATRHGVYALLGERYAHESWLLVFPYEGAKFALFACLWLGVIFSLDSHAHWQHQQQRLLVLQRSLSEARLAQLSAQLRPHFFFNALNTISALMHVDVARADRLLATLGELLRASLQSTPQELVPLRRELHLLGLYAQVMAERFADRVTLEWDIEPATQDAAVPALLLQPLLENAFRHGVERCSGTARICIGARIDGRRLVLVVANTGSRLSEPLREGIGLRNCRERLTELYGVDAQLHLTVAAGDVTARVLLPLRIPAP